MGRRRLARFSDRRFDTLHRETLSVTPAVRRLEAALAIGVAALWFNACVDPMPRLEDARAPTPTTSTLPAAPTDEGDELARLRDENARLREENERLRSLVGSTPAPAPALSAAAALATVEAPAAVDLNSVLVVTMARARVTEANSSWQRFAWQMTIKNTGQQDASFDLQVEFIDRDGFTVDRSGEGRVVIPGGSERSFSGDKLVTMPGALSVTGIRAKAA